MVIACQKSLSEKPENNVIFMAVAEAHIWKDRLIKEQITVKQLAQKLAINPNFIYKRLKLLSLSSTILKQITSNSLSPLISIKDLYQACESLCWEKQELIKILNNQNQPNIKIGDKCFKPFDCQYQKHCWQNIPDYSIFNVCHRKTTAERIADEINSYDVNDIDVNDYEKGIKELDIICYQENRTHIDKEKLSEFLSTLKYPLYFLDYESFSLAIPILQNTRPYQQIPFQFSLHIQDKPNGELKHFEFLYQNNSDPREDFIQNLIKYCQNDGSIKKVLPAFTDLDYQDLEIKSGGDAMDIYADFIKGKTSLESNLIQNLLEYCKLDTYAMVKLLEELFNFVKK